MQEDNVVDLPTSGRQTQQEAEAESLAYSAHIANTAIRILNARLIGILALLGAIGIWALAVIEPDSLRTWSAAIYSGTVLVPSLLLYKSRG